MMNFEDKELLYVIVDGGREFLGVWGPQEDDKFVKLYDAVHSINQMVPDPVTGQPRPSKALVGVEETGNFSKDILINKDKILFIKRAVFKSDAYNVYVETVTGIQLVKGGIIPKGEVVAFRRRIEREKEKE